MKDMRASNLELAPSLRYLGLFGLTHGLHEWLQLYPLIEGEHLTVQEIFLIKAIALGLFIISYLFLLRFGIALIRDTHNRKLQWLSVTPLVLTVLSLTYGMAHRGVNLDLQFLRQASIGVRYTFGLLGGLLAAYGLIAYSRGIRHLSRFVARRLHYAGVTFAFYAVFAGVVTSEFTLFPLPVPIEILRGLSAVLITYFIIKGLNIFDIEMRRNVEEQARRIMQAEKLTSLGQLAAGIAHEINNPLTNASLGIQTLKSKMQDDGFGSVIVERLDAVERNIDRASLIARELLQFSRQRVTEFIPVDINDIVRGALTLLQYKLKDIAVQQELSKLPLVLGDPGKLEQVFINVLSNAVEAMPGGGTVSILTTRTSAGVRVRIADTGTGIQKKNVSRVFDPFFTTKEPGAGTGLGLSICYGIIKDHHGTVDITSTPGKGTVVTFTVPEREGHA
jgi:two-component system NtrC family sensor kinase